MTEHGIHWEELLVAQFIQVRSKKIKQQLCVLDYSIIKSN